MIPNLTAAFSSVVGAVPGQRHQHEAADPYVIDVQPREVDEPARREPLSLVAAYDGYRTYLLLPAPSEKR